MVIRPTTLFHAYDMLIMPKLCLLCLYYACYACFYEQELGVILILCDLDLYLAKLVYNILIAKL